MSISRSQGRKVYGVDPLSDARWGNLLIKSPRSSVFHTKAWLGALYRTYGYRPLAYTTSPPDGELRNALVACRTRSWVTGSNLVSLPFSDHCDILVEDAADLEAISATLEAELGRMHLRYLELRPISPLNIESRQANPSPTCCLHVLNLEPSTEALYQNLHKNSVKRKLRRAEREGLRYEEGRSPELLEAFDKLWIMTRRRHSAPPPPRKWFENLIDCFGESLKIRVAWKENQAIAAIITISHNGTLVYKYGGSDERYHNLGGIQFLFWTSIRKAKERGLKFFDFGRTDIGNKGLLTFKERWGTERLDLTYWILSPSTASQWAPVPPLTHSLGRIGARIASALPDVIFRSIGSAVYPHMG